MDKNFDHWNREKKVLESTEYKPLSFHEQDIWWCSIGLNIGDEQDGKNTLYERPVLILKKFNTKIVWVIPITSKHKTGPYYYPVFHDGKQFMLILSQLRLMSVKRLQRFVRKIPRGQFKEIQKSLIQIILQ